MKKIIYVLANENSIYVSNQNTTKKNINSINTTCFDYNSALETNSASSENLLGSEKTNSSTNKNNILNTDGNLNLENKKKLLKNEEFTLNKRNNNDFIEILDNINIKEINNLENILNSLENKLDQKLLSIKQENEKNKILNLTKKFSAYKSIFEETIKSVNELSNIKSNNLFLKIFNGYNDTVHTLFMNFSKLHEKYSEGETIYQSKVFKKNKIIL